MNMKHAKLGKGLALLFAAVLALTAAGCGSAQTGNNRSDGSLQKILDAGQLVLGLDTEFPPMGYIDETGEIVGFDIDVAQEVCDRLGVTLVKQGIDWDTKEDDLNKGNIDCIWNGMSVTPARAEEMNLSEPYMKNEVIVVVLGSSDIEVLRDLAGRKVGVQSGSTAQDVLETSDKVSDISIVTFDDNMELLKKLEQEEVDAALVDSVVAYHFIFSSDRKYYVLPDSLDEEEYAIGFRKGDQALRDRVQEILSEMKADGTLGVISKKWFGSDITTVR